MKTFFPGIVCLFFFINTQAQTCVPDTTNFELIGINQSDIPCIVQGQNYAYSVYYYVPDSAFGFQIISAKLTSVVGLPAGITYTCATANCIIQATEHGALCISGITNVPIGYYDVKFNGSITTSQGTFSLDAVANAGGPSTTYTFTVMDSTGTCPNILSGVSTIHTNKGGVVAYPTRTTDVVTVSSKQSDEKINSITVTNIAGQMVFKLLPDLNSSEVDIHLKQFGTGLYLMQIATNLGNTVKRVVVE